MSNQRLAIAKKIEEFEAKGYFDIDVNDDPPTRQLKVGEVDYKYKKLSTRFSTKIANFVAKRYIEGLIKKKQLIIKEVKGIENYKKIKNMGAIITCNHFHPFDNFAVLKAIEKELKKEPLYKVIREGNYTNFPGLYGYFFKHCNTLPLSSNIDVMKEFLGGVEHHLKNKKKILIYPEQAMWFNYKKPRPLKPGAFNFAVSFNVPILPIFITMEDSEVIDADGYPIQAYTVHIMPPVALDTELSRNENIKMMSNEVYNLMKEKYEEVYQIPLVYHS